MLSSGFSYTINISIHIVFM